MISAIDKDLIMVIGDPTRDYKRRSFGLEKNRQEEQVPWQRLSFPAAVIQQREAQAKEETQRKWGQR